MDDSDDIIFEVETVSPMWFLTRLCAQMKTVPIISTQTRTKGFPRHQARIEILNFHGQNFEVSGSGGNKNLAQNLAAKSMINRHLHDFILIKPGLSSIVHISADRTLYVNVNPQHSWVTTGPVQMKEIRLKMPSPVKNALAYLTHFCTSQRLPKPKFQVFRTDVPDWPISGRNKGKLRYLYRSTCEVGDVAREGIHAIEKKAKRKAAALVLAALKQMHPIPTPTIAKKCQECAVDIKGKSEQNVIDAFKFYVKLVEKYKEIDDLSGEIESDPDLPPSPPTFVEDVKPLDDSEVNFSKMLVRQFLALNEKPETYSIDNYILNHPASWAKLSERVREMCDVCAIVVIQLSLAAS